VIDFYRLKKAVGNMAFDSYRNEHVICVVSGMGPINMAAATAWAAAHFAQNNVISWINIGVAGHRNLAIGTPVLAGRVSQVDNPDALYPVPLIKHSFDICDVVSQYHENTDYDKKALYDLEAYAYLHSASRFSALELCQCFKIVSDNTETAPNRDKARISRLIAQHMSAFDSYAQKLIELGGKLASELLNEVDYQRFISLAHFTQTQQVQLKKVLTGLQVYDESLDHVYNNVNQITHSKQILSQLQHDLHHRSEQL
jgi:hypothetical protein